MVEILNLQPQHVDVWFQNRKTSRYTEVGICSANYLCVLKIDKQFISDVSERTRNKGIKFLVLIQCFFNHLIGTWSFYMHIPCMDPRVIIFKRAHKICIIPGLWTMCLTNVEKRLQSLLPIFQSSKKRGRVTIIKVFSDLFLLLDYINFNQRIELDK